LSKILLLLTSQRAPDADEAIVGLMGLHVSQGISHPLFFYGQTYDAGSGVLAHASAIVFYLAGFSPVSLKAVGFGVWLLVSVAAALIMRKPFGSRAAALTGALILWCPTSVEWAVKTRGGYMLAVLLSVITVGIALRERPGFGRSAVIGLFGAAAVWAQPISLPLIAAVMVWLVVESFLERRMQNILGLGGAAGALSILPVVAMMTSSTSWSWQAIVSGKAEQHNPVQVIASIVPYVFTPEMDWSWPAPPRWVVVVGILWLIAATATCIFASVAVWRKTIDERLRRPAGLLVAAAFAAPLAMFMTDAGYVRPRHILIFYPLACMVIAGVVTIWSQMMRKRWPYVLTAGLLLSGGAVHLAYTGPASIHGGGEQEVRIPADVVDRMLVDLDNHHVRCVFSESPMLQWNLMFASHERVAARWLTPQDRWQPYVDRVNAAFAAGEPCALLVRNLPYHDPIPRLREHFLNAPNQFTAFSDDYALLYNPPRQYIAEHFR
jgi:hypothetical protein